MITDVASQVHCKMSESTAKHIEFVFDMLQDALLRLNTIGSNRSCRTNHSRIGPCCNIDVSLVQKGHHTKVGNKQYMSLYFSNTLNRRYEILMVTDEISPPNLHELNMDSWAGCCKCEMTSIPFKSEQEGRLGMIHTGGARPY